VSPPFHGGIVLKIRNKNKKRLAIETQPMQNAQPRENLQTLRIYRSAQLLGNQKFGNRMGAGL